MDYYETELADIRAAAQDAMRDTCKIGTRGTPADYDPDNVTWTYGSAIDCGLLAKTKNEVKDGSQISVTDATLRLPWGTSIAPKDRVKVTHKNGEALATPLIYAVIGTVDGTIANVVITLELVTGSSGK